MHNYLDLNRQECNMLKGFAIICIFLHNYCHLLPHSPQENEYFWSIDNTEYFYNSLFDDFFINLFSFLGHYGVAVFVFLSGYGLVRKYENLETSNINKFIVKHFMKLFKLMFPGVIVYYAVNWILYGDFDELNILRFSSQLLFLNNLIPTKISPIVPGPYWYFGLTMQLYLIYLLLYKRSGKKQWVFALFCVSALIMSKNHHYLTVWIKYNFVGSIIPFILGISIAKYKLLMNYHHKKWFYAIIAVISFVLLLISEYSYYTWIFSSVFVICFSICIIKISIFWVATFFSFIGRISHLIFVIHPIVRLLILYLQQGSVIGWQFWIILYAGLTLGISSLFRYHSTFIIKK